jgi:hypothetical protein
MGVGVAGSVIGNALASKNMNAYRKQLEKQKQENEDWYNRRYNEDPLARSSSQRMLTKTEEAFKNRNRQAAATAAVTGGTEESVAATKAANAQAMADATGQIAVNAEARKDNIESNYMARKNQLDSQVGSTYVQQAQQVANAGNGVLQAGAKLAGALEGGDDESGTGTPATDKKKKEPTAYNSDPNNELYYNS